jgi:hypothetical protein
MIDADAMEQAIAKLVAARIEGGDNPVSYALLGILQSACEENLNREHDEHLTRLNRAHVEASMAALRAIPDATWGTWCDVSKETTLAMADAAVRGASWMNP